MVQRVKNLPAMQETQVQPLGWEDPWEKEMATHSSILAWRIPMDRGAWRATVHGIPELDTTERLTQTHTHTLLTPRTSLVGQTVKNLPAMQETWVRSLGQEDPLEEGMATHSSILAWRIPMDRGAWQATIHGVAKHQT